MADYHGHVESESGVPLHLGETPVELIGGGHLVKKTTECWASRRSGEPFTSLVGCWVGASVKWRPHWLRVLSVLSRPTSVLSVLKSLSGLAGKRSA